MRLANKVAIITGAGSGIGRASAVLFAREGARVVVADINAAQGEETVALIRAAGGEAVFQSTDVAEPAQIERMVGVAEARFGGLDILFNNAGIMPPGTAETQTIEEFDRTIAVNLRAVMLGVRYALPLLRRRGGGSVISTASPTGVLGHNGLVAYSASKGGVIAMTRAMAFDHARDRVRVNCIVPGTVNTGMLRDYLATVADVDAAMRGFIANHPLGRIAEPEDIAYAALYLASDESSFVTGACLVVDGGYTMAKTQPT